jgi:protein-S-isoprenylcysteine O-methyltransferase Ste14
MAHLEMSTEEHDLVELFGDGYLKYKRQVSMLVPWRKTV